jgi:cobalamin biosynthesis protein CbiD
MSKLQSLTALTSLSSTVGLAYNDVMTNPADHAPEPNETGASRRPEGTLRTGWTTGACATAATKAALTALLSGDFPDPVTIRLPRGETPAFALATERLGNSFAEAGIVKDAGDDPDVTHGATVVSRVRLLPPGSGIRFAAGDGVGTVTRPGLPIGVGEPAINPVPRAMMGEVIEEVCSAFGKPADVEITISIPGGAAIAEKTWNPRLGIVGGLSVLGTTGIVHPFSCAAWIHSIHRGIDVARAIGLTHVLGATGSSSEKAAQEFHHLPEEALLDMGDFAGGLLKYLRVHPVPRLTIAGGFAKLAKLAQGALDLHSSRSQVDMQFLESLIESDKLTQALRNRIQSANTALEVYEITKENGIDLAASVAARARSTAINTLRGAPVVVDILVTDRKGTILAHVG